MRPGPRQRGLFALALLGGMTLITVGGTAKAQTVAPGVSTKATVEAPSDQGAASNRPANTTDVTTTTTTTSAATGSVAAADPAAVAAIARELNCPLCQGYSLLDCPLQVCGQMRQLIAERLAEGWTPDQVRAQFVADYGPQILSAPPTHGWGLAAWLAPLFAALAGAGLLWLRRRSTVGPMAESMDGAGDLEPASPMARTLVDPEEADRRRRLEALARDDA